MTDEDSYEVLSFDDVAEAMADIRRQYEAGETPLVWRGADRLHHSIAAGCPPPSELFSPEGLAYSEEQGHDFWDVYTMVSFQLGFHNGALREGGTWRRAWESSQRHAERLQAEIERMRANG